MAKPQPHGPVALTDCVWSTQLLRRDTHGSCVVVCRNSKQVEAQARTEVPANSTPMLV